MSDGYKLIVNYRCYPLHKLDLKKTSLTVNEDTLQKLKERELEEQKRIRDSSNASCTEADLHKWAEREYNRKYGSCNIICSSDLGDDNASGVTTSLNFFGREFLHEDQRTMLLSSRTLFFYEWKVRGWSLWCKKITELSK
jgi:hypothetical protein